MARSSNLKMVVRRNLEFGRNIQKISIFQKSWGWLPLVWEMWRDLGRVFLSYPQDPSAHMGQKSQNRILNYSKRFAHSAGPAKEGYGQVAL